MLVRHSFDARFLAKMREISDKYGTKMLDLDGIGQDVLDINVFTKSFLQHTGSTANLSVDPNANVDDKSVVSFETEFAKSIHRLNAYYINWELMVNDPELGIKRANKLLEMSINGTLKLHDLHFWSKSYCYGFSLSENVINGLTFVNTVKIGPPKHVTSFINHVIQFLAYASNQIAGASAFPDFFVYLDWFCRKDWQEDYINIPEFQIRLAQEFQSFVFSLAWPFRSGGQSSFVNLSIFDHAFLDDLFGELKYPDFSSVNTESVYKLQEFYMRWFVEQSKTQTFTFPINTVMFHTKENKIQDKELLETTSELNAVNGAFNIYCGPLGKISSCCRLVSDINEIGYTNSFGAGGVSIGSHRVVTLNLPRLALESDQDQEKFLKNVEYATLAAQDILFTHRKLLKNLILLKKLPLYTHNYMHLDKQFSTVGFIGLYEAMNILGIVNGDYSWASLGIKTLNKINELNKIKASKTGTIFNLEQIPGESAAYVFADKDKLLFQNHRYDIYSNQYLPLWENLDLTDRIKIAGKFDKLCSGGAITHINISDSLTTDQMKRIIEYSAENGMVYFAINIAQCRCNTCDKLFIGKFEKSPCHNADVTKYLRVVGFLTPIKNWAKPRQVEYEKRQFYQNTINTTE